MALSTKEQKMKRLSQLKRTTRYGSKSACVAIIIAATCVATTSLSGWAQPPEGPPPGGPGAPGRAGGPGGPGEPGRSGGPPRFPIMEALDADGNREISAEEIAGAAEALKSLDKNNDGKLTRDEFLPERRRGGERAGQGGPEGRRTRSQGRDERPGAGGPGERGGDGGAGGPGGRGAAPGGDGARGAAGPSSEKIVARFMKFDDDGDEELSRDELPERMHRVFDRADEDGDDSLSKEELQTMAQNAAERSGNKQRKPNRRSGKGSFSE